MRQLDRIAIQETGPMLLQMMENAGRSLAELTIELLGPLWQRALVVVLAGRGGNGGGGICAARHLANHGARVALAFADSGTLSEAARTQRWIFGSTSGREVTGDELRSLSPDLILDALIGYGLHAAPSEPVADLTEWANVSKASILALDVPSGIDATTGEAPGLFIRPRWTMTLALPKTGLLPHRTGSLFLADIGLPERAYQKIDVPVRPPFGARAWIPVLSRDRDFVIAPFPAAVGGPEEREADRRVLTKGRGDVHELYS